MKLYLMTAQQRRELLGGLAMLGLVVPKADGITTNIYRAEVFGTVANLLELVRTLQPIDDTAPAPEKL
jgi:hypothetical protein